MKENNINKSIRRLKKYIEEDAIYERYKNGEYDKVEGFEKFCITHCQDIENLLEAYKKLKNLIKL